MTVYIETNFILEIALLQEQWEHCEQILALCDALDVKVAVPSYCLVEPFETLIRRQRNRTRMKEELDRELMQISRTETNRQSLSEFENITNILPRSAQDDSSRFDRVCETLLQTCDIIPLNSEILMLSGKYRQQRDLTHQDAIVYTTILSELGKRGSSRNFFISRDGDFTDQDTIDELQGYNCTLLTDFGHAYHVIRRGLS